MIQISGIPSQEIDEIWEACEPFIDLAYKKGQGEMKTEDICDKKYKFNQIS